MNKYLFRGLTEDKKWVYGDLSHRKVWSDIVTIISCYDEEFDNYTEYIVEAETAGMCSGVADKHGKPIFDGDIVTYKEIEQFYDDDHPLESAELIVERNRIVTFADGKFEPLPIISYCEDPWYNSGACDFEVIGTIFDGVINNG